MTAPRPSRIRVGPLTYQVLTDPAEIKRVSANADMDPGNEWTAYSDHDALLIGINANLPLARQQHDMVHELLHCCLRSAGVEPNQYAVLVQRAEGRHGGYSVEEFTVAAITGPLLGVLRDNPELTRWLLLVELAMDPEWAL